MNCKRITCSRRTPTPVARPCRNLYTTHGGYIFPPTHRYTRSDTLNYSQIKRYQRIDVNPRFTTKSCPKKKTIFFFFYVEHVDYHFIKRSQILMPDSISTMKISFHVVNQFIASRSRFFARTDYVQARIDSNVRLNTMECLYVYYILYISYFWSSDRHFISCLQRITSYVLWPIFSRAFRSCTLHNGSDVYIWWIDSYYFFFFSFYFFE